MTHSDKDRPVAGISSMAMRHALLELCDDYSRHAGRPVSITAVGGVDAIRRIRTGEAFDFAVLAADAIDDLVRSGHLDATTRVDLARSGVAIAVAAGAPMPSITTEDALREAVLGARSISLLHGPERRSSRPPVGALGHRGHRRAACRASTAWRSGRHARRARRCRARFSAAQRAAARSGHRRRRHAAGRSRRNYGVRSRGVHDGGQPRCCRCRAGVFRVARGRCGQTAARHDAGARGCR